MTFDEIVAGVMEKTMRPDLVDLHTSAVQNATLAVHSLDFFEKDRVVSQVTPVLQSVDSNVYTISTRNNANLPRFRKEARQIVNDKYNPLYKCELIDATSLWDDYNILRKNVFYRIGAELILRPTWTVTTVWVDYYAYPGWLKAAYDSWIAEEYPLAIINKATSVIFKSIGKDEESAQYKEMEKTDNAIIIGLGIAEGAI